MLELYNLNNSTCSQKVRLTLAEKNLAFVDRQVSLKDNEQYSDWYLKLNPNGVVPTLVHDGRAVIDSTVICEYLDDAFPEVPLSPSDPWARARMRAWLQYIDEVPTPAVRIPSFNAYIIPSWSATNERWAVDRKAKSPLRKAQFRRLGPNGYPDEDVDDALEKLRQTVERIELSLLDGPWLVGEQFTIADICMIPCITRLYDLELSHFWKDSPHVADWFTRIQRRPSFEKAYYPGSRMSVVRQLIESSAVSR